MKKQLLSSAIIFVLMTTTSTVNAKPTVYIPLGSGNQVIEIDAATDKITKTFMDVENAHGLVATPDGEYLIAGSLKETPAKKGPEADINTSKLFVIHPVHGHVMSTIPVVGWTHHQAITPDGRYILSTHGTRGYITVADLQTNAVVKTINTGAVPNYTLITKDGKFAYVSNSGNNTISEINLKTWEVSRSLESGPSPEHMTFSSDESQIFVTNPRAGSVAVISRDNGKLLKSYEVGKSVHGLDIGDDGKTLFVSSKKDEKLVSIDTDSGDKRELALSPAPYHLNTIPGTGKVYVSSRSSPKIWVIDQNSLKITAEIKLPAGEGHQMAIIK